MPSPGDELIARVAGREGSDRAGFFWSGRESVRELERTVSAVGRSLDSFQSILDFGCGCGRMLLWMEGLGTTPTLHGTDTDTEAIAWCREHLPYARFMVNEPDPPLPYPDGAFDLVFNHSVFTHIDERRQDLWLAELWRVTQPGGFLVLTVLGEAGLSGGDSEVRDRLEREGIAFLEGSMPGDSPFPAWYQNTLHAPWYVFEHWGRWFEIRSYLPGAALGKQDHVVLRRSTDDALPRRPLAARPGLPAAGAPVSRVRYALTAARNYRGIAPTTHSRSGPLRALLRRAMLRAIRPYTLHQDKFDDAVVASIEELTRASDHQTALLGELSRKQQRPTEQQDELAP